MDEPIQNSSVSSDFTSKLLNLENPSLANNEIASLMDTIVHHEEPRSQTSSLYTVPVTATPKFNDRVTNLEKNLSEIKQVDQYAQALSSIPAIVDRYIDNKRGEAIQKAIMAHNLDCREEAQAKKRDYIELVDTSMRVILKEKKNVIESLEVLVLERSSSQPNSTYKVAASLSEFELTKILIDKMEKSKSYDKSDYKRELYDALVKSYQTDKDLFDTYGEVFVLKRSRDMSKIKIKTPLLDQTEVLIDGSQARKLSHPEIQEEPSHTVDDSRVQQDQEFYTGNNDEQLADKEATTERLDWHNPEGKPYPFDLNKPLLLIPDNRGHQVATYKIKWIEDLVRNLWSPVKVIYDKHAYLGTSYWGPKCQRFYWFASNMTSSKDVYYRKQIITVTRLTIMKKYDYGHLEMIKVRREDQQLYTFKEGDFPRLRLQDIEDMLLLLVQ
ncbi:hypothetical protein Tco_1418090 [Tanacetum coccineum]